tara:strand:+ start:249 stop:407 length:159 start_codon:yes stop_codon:yes gene_type:complete
MTKKKEVDVKKYSNADLQKMRTKFIIRDYSEGWYRKHFLGMMGYIEWLNGKE